MSQSRGKFHKARFCPWCGTPTIERDMFGSQKTIHRNVAYICSVCNTGFALKISPRAEFALKLFQQDRQLRPPFPK